MKFGSVVHEMLFKDISYLELWQPFCSVDWNHLCIFCRRHHEEQSFEIILNLDQWFRWKCCFKVFLSGALAGFCSVEHNHLCIFGRGYYEEQFCEIILNLGQWLRRCCLKDVLSGALATHLFSGAKPFMQF